MDYPATDLVDVDSLVAPQFQDMLGGTRLSHAAGFAPAQDRVLEFHPENQSWSQAAMERANLFVLDYRGLPLSLLSQRLVRACR